jgi:hypothetical protein
MNDTVRLRIWRRDDFKCRYCDYDARDSFESFRRARLAVDHLKPSGGDGDSNLVTCCAACNADKGRADYFDSVESVRRFLRLYRKECSRPCSIRSLRLTTDQRTRRVGIGRSVSKRPERGSRQGRTSQNEAAGAVSVPIAAPSGFDARLPRAAFQVCHQGSLVIGIVPALLKRRII